MVIKTPIIPIRPMLAKVDAPHELHLEAICIFTAIGFFLDQDTYWKDEIVLRAASDNTIDSEGILFDSKPWFNWHYAPRDISFDQALAEFTELFETIIGDAAQDKRVILPISGGLDSRTQAIALKNCNADVFVYSYEFENGYHETKIAKQIAKDCDFDFRAYIIRKGYLWSSIDTLVDLNHCYSDFTSPRQMAVYNEFDSMGDVFSLGHWGDVLFDNMGLPKLSEEAQVEVLFKKLIKSGGLDLSTQLWNLWGLSGNFEAYFRMRLKTLLTQINIEDTNAKLRAFKSLYWAPRWTSVNLSVFSSKKPITLPYYDDRMCQFICTVPEDYLNSRKLQIAYIKAKAPELAKITWQDHRPFNLYNYHYNKMPYNLSYKATNKLFRMLKSILGRSYVQRNWELQFVGTDNEKHLKAHLFETKKDDFIPEPFIETYYNSFLQGNKIDYAHAINMLLVLSKFNQIYRHA